MKNTLKTQIAVAMVVSLFFGALGFVVDREGVSTNPLALPSRAETVQAKSIPVLARPLNFGFVPKAEFSLQGADMAGYLSTQNFSIQMGTGYAENLQRSAPVPLLSSRSEVPAFALEVQPLHLAVSISSPESEAFGIWSTGQALPGFPPMSQALVPVLGLVFLFVKIKPLRQRGGRSDGLQSREIFVFDNFFQTNRILRC